MNKFIRAFLFCFTVGCCIIYYIIIKQLFFTTEQTESTNIRSNPPRLIKIDSLPPIPLPLPIPIDTFQSNTVAILIPVRSLRGTTDVSQLSLFQELLPSFLKTFQCDNNKQIVFSIWIGYDAGDDYYDNANNLQIIQSQYEKMWTQTTHIYSGLPFLPPKLHTHRFVGALSSPCWIWNGLFQQAYEQGIQYFMQINDDTRILTGCWASSMISIFKQVPYQMGVVGPMDINNPKVLTQAMLSRTHFAIFSAIYPHNFRNWYSDDWLSQVYGTASTYMIDNVRMLNSNSQGTRYKKFTKVAETLDVEIDKGKRKIDLWFRQQKKNDT